jgi:hypothetical protein
VAGADRDEGSVRTRNAGELDKGSIRSNPYLPGIVREHLAYLYKKQLTEMLSTLCSAAHVKVSLKCNECGHMWVFCGKGDTDGWWHCPRGCNETRDRAVGDALARGSF